MTAIVGIFCSDGVVIGSDSSASFGPHPQHLTIELPVKKVQVINGQVIVACTGYMGHAQRFTEILTNYWDKKQWRGPGGSGSKSRIEIGKDLCAQAVTDFAYTQTKQGTCGALVAFQSNKRPQLCEFQLSDFQPEFKDENLWFTSLGSGQPITDPFLGMMRKVFWKDKIPTLKEGLFAVTWTLRHVIELNPGGINGPPQIATMDMNGEAKLLTDDDMAEHVGNAVAAEEHLAKFKLQERSAPPIPNPPPSA